MLLFLALVGCVTDEMVLPLYDRDHDGFYDELAAEAGAAGPYDCDDGDADVHPGAPELCDGVDDDCDATTGDDDGEDAQVWHLDADHDGYGATDATRTACDPVDGYVADATDCDDLDAGVHPGADDGCNDVDDDCDGTTDEDKPAWYLDADGDGYGRAGTDVDACGEPVGYVANADDCDDDDAAVSPDGTEVCDGVDNDCDGLLDRDDPSNAGDATWHADADGDGYGSPESTQTGCSQPAGYVRNASDCDDATAEVHPKAIEACESGLDEDCDGVDATCGVTSRSLGDASAIYVTGASDIDAFGYSVAIADADGDGVSDLLLPYLSKASFEGEIEVVPGAATLYLGDRIAPADAASTWSGSSGDFAVGISIAAAGDVDGDGLTDVLVAQGSETTSAGSAYLVYGGSGSVVTSSLPQFVGESVGDKAGRGVGAVGDFSGDGVDDVVLGAPAWSDLGRIYLFRGGGSRFTGTSSVTSAYATWTQSSADYGHAGSVLASGDLDGDGRADLAVGADCGGCASRVYVLAGATKWSGDASLADADAVLAPPASALDWGIAESVAVGDVDGDGYADVLAGAPARTSDTGSAFLFSGGASLKGDLDTSSATAQLVGSDPGDRAGEQVLVADVDADGKGDVVVAAPSDGVGATGAGSVYVVRGGALSGTLDLASAADQLTGVADADEVGSSLAAGDVNGDGAADLLIGADAGMSHEGAIYLVYGAP